MIKIDEFLNAAENDNLEIVQQYIEQNLHNPNAVNIPGKEGSALLLASSEGHAHIVETLLKVPGILYNAPDNEGNTPLIFASGDGHLSIVKLLLAQSLINLDSADIEGRTALIEAAAEGEIDIINLLLSAGADPTCKTNEGETAASVLLANKNINEILNSKSENKLEKFCDERNRQIAIVNTLYSLDKEKNAYKQEKTQQLIEDSLYSISNNLEFIQNNLYEIKDLTILNNIIPSFTNLLSQSANLFSVLGEEDKQFENISHSLRETSAYMGNEEATRIVGKFKNINTKDENKILQPEVSKDKSEELDKEKIRLKRLAFFNNSNNKQENKIQKEFVNRP